MTIAIHVENWFGLEKADLTLSQPLTILTGDHEAGKSALGHDALEFAVTGELASRRLGRGKALAQEAVRDGTKGALVSVALGGVHIERTLSAGGKQTLSVIHGEETVDGALADIERQLYDLLGISKLACIVALNSWAYFNALSDADRASVLFRALHEGIDAGQVAELLVEKGVDGTLAKKWAEKAVVGGFEAMQKAAEKARAEQTGAAKAARDAIAPEEQRISIGGRAIELAQVDLEDVRSKREEAYEALAKMEASAGADLGKAQAEVEHLERQQKEFQVSLDALAQDDGEDPAALEARFAELTTAEAELSKRVQEATREFEETRKVAGGLKLDRPKLCPVISRFACPVTDGMLEKHRKELVPQVAKANDRLEALEEERGKLLTDQQALADEQARIEAAIRGIRERAARRESYQGRLKLIEEPLRLAREKVSELSGRFNAEKAGALRERIELNDSLLSAHARWLERCERNEKQQERAAKAEEDRESFDKIAQAFKPDAIPRKLIEERLPELQERMDEVAVGTGLGSIEIDAEKLDILVVRGKQRLRYPSLSRAARLRFSVSIQHAIAQGSKLGILVVDEADVFRGAKAREAFYGSMLSLAERHGVHVLTIGAKDPEVPVRPALEGVAMAWLKDGQVVEVE